MNPSPANPEPTVPVQPESRVPLKRGLPLVLVLIAIVAVIAISNLSSLFTGKQNSAPKSSLAMRPTSPNAQQVTSFTAQQQLQAERDAEELRRKQQLESTRQELEARAVPSPESETAPAMTPAQRDAIYGANGNGHQRTSNQSEALAQAKQRALAREKQRNDALQSATLAIDFSSTTSTENPPSSSSGSTAEQVSRRDGRASGSPGASARETSAMDRYDFDGYDGQLYRIFEGTVLEGVVTNHIDGGLSGPTIVMLTTDYYSHDHQKLLMPQGTRLLGSVERVGNTQQRKMFVSFHRAVCPDGFSIDFDRFLGLDPLGTTGLATKVDHGYLMAFGAAAAIGGLGGLAQIGNNGTVFDPSIQIRNGISSQTAAEGQQVLNHFLNRLPVITLNEGSRARVYIGRDLLVPSYDDHRVNPTL